MNLTRLVNHCVTAATVFVLSATTLLAEDARDHFRRGVALQNEGKYSEAIKAYNESIRLDSTIAQAYASRGYCKGRINSDRSDIIEDYSRAIRLNTKDPIVWGNRGATFFRLARHSPEPAVRIESRCKAISDLEKAIALGADFTDYYLMLSELQIDNDDLSSAQTTCAKGLARSSTSNPRLLSQRGWARYLFGDYRRALEDLNRSCELDPSVGLRYFRRGRVREKLGFYDNAVEDFSRAIQLNDRDYDSHYLRAYCNSSKLNQFRPALDDCNRALQLIPDTIDNTAFRADIVELRAWIHRRLGDTAQYERDQSEVIRLRKVAVNHVEDVIARLNGGK